MSALILQPAYGRDYKSKAAAVADFNGNKDFIIANWGHPYSGRPVSKSQLSAGDPVNIRYDNDRKVAVLKVVS